MTLYKFDAELVGKEVVCGDGRDLGEVKDIQVEVESWRVRGIIVRLNRDVLEDLHLKKPLMGSQEVLVSVSQVHSVSDRMLLKPSLEDFGKIATPEDGEEGG